MSSGSDRSPHSERGVDQTPSTRVIEPRRIDIASARDTDDRAPSEALRVAEHGGDGKGRGAFDAPPAGGMDRRHRRDDGGLRRP